MYLVCVCVFITIELGLNMGKDEKFCNAFLFTSIPKKPVKFKTRSVLLFHHPSLLIIAALDVEKSLVSWVGSCFSQ